LIEKITILPGASGQNDNHNRDILNHQ